MTQTEMFPKDGISETDYYRNKYLEALVEIDQLQKTLTNLQETVRVPKAQTSCEVITEEKDATPNA